ncbi:FAD-dependent oxidoreductase [Frigoribacterium sp. CFBP 13729]|uniref:NAD(P)-binding domain-containing protein n=1 Tax=Frigoribacterium sp. CFBP 13729 TaxID=2775293 RepID=UPI001783D5E2|nr:NAD(P)-binding domain-containing protein [Frigoribacterium sp. CFBP 13729]MBD8611159.1 FAD-dependent oxidoreductase [Frigoribacterium sp. CFBP 13729]
MSLTLSVPPRTDAPTLAGLPVAVIGAGPVGLAAAAQLLERGVDVVIYEAGPSAATAVRAWGHTRLFTPWEHLVDPAAARLLDTIDWEAPAAKKLPYGADFVRDYLEPLAATPELSGRIRYGHRVAAVSRQGMDRTRSTGRAETPFLLRLDHDGEVRDELARAVIDTSGTYSTPNTLTSSGVGLSHGDDIAGSISHALPDVLGRDRDRFAGRHTVVVGAGHSAANTLIKLATLAKEVPGTTITWAIRSSTPARVYGSAADQLEGRGDLGSAVRDLVRAGAIALVDRFEVDDVAKADEGVQLVGRRRGEPLTVAADVVVNATGFRPDLDMLREIRASLDEIVEAPRQLAPLIDPNLHSCGTVYPHGVAELGHPEPNFYIAGMKSYGRAPTFLLLTGYEQVRSIADELAGNHEAARLVQLELPDTGVCSTNLPDASGCAVDGPAAGGCCS